MKQFIFKFKCGKAWILSALPLIALLTLFSCVRETQLYPEVNDDEALVTLSLNVPAATRSLNTEQEDAVKSIQVLAFENTGTNKFAYSATTTNMVSANKFQVTLRKGTWNLVVLANAPDVLSQLTVGESQDDALEKLSKSITAGAGWVIADLQTKGIPMSSVVREETIGDGTSIPSVDLYRMVARVNISVAATASNFKLSSVRVYNYEKTGKIYPTLLLDPEDSNPKPTYDLPSLLSEKILGKSDTEKLRYTATDGITDKTCTNIIYLNPAAAGANNDLPNNTCLVIGGIFGEDDQVSYYRVDFSDGDTYFNLIRNHTYRINITKVSARGETGENGENDAFDASPVNMTVQIVPWNDGETLYVKTDGIYELGVNRKKFDFSKEAVSGTTGEDNKLIVQTTYPDTWTVEVTDENGEPLDDEWLKVKIGTEPAKSELEMDAGTTGPQYFYLQADKNEGTAPRIAYIRVTAGRIIQEIIVEQGISSAISLKLTDGTKEVTELLWTNGNFSQKELNVTWVPENENCTITEAVAGGGGFVHEVSSPFGNETTDTGTQTYFITPAALPTSTTDDPNYPFIDRSSNVSFRINNGETSIIKTVSLRQVNYALTVNDSQNPAAKDVLTDKEYTLVIKCNTDWTVTKGDFDGLTADDVEILSGSINQPDNTAGTTFKYKIKTGKYGSVKFTFTPKTGTPVSIKITSVEKLLPVFALSNIVYDGEKLTFAEDEEALISKGIPANAQGLYFKWGSLIGIGGINASFSAATHLPMTDLPGYDGQTLSDITYENIPYRSESEGAFSTSSDEFILAYPLTGFNAESGKGDICRYISAQNDWVTGNWRMPTAQEMDDFYRSSGIVSLSQEGMYGYRFGEISWVGQDPGDSSGMSTIDGGWYWGPGVTGKPAGPTSSTVLFPASGYVRDDSIFQGKPFDTGARGLYATCTLRNAAHVYLMDFWSWKKDPDYRGRGGDAFSVRCVKADR